MAGFWYRAGTVSVTNASKKVVGSGTLFKTTTFKPDKGHAFYGPDGKPYEIDYVESDTVLYLVKAYSGATAVGQAYEIDITRTSTIPALSREISAQLAYAQGQYDSWQQILTGSGNVTLTSPDGQSVTVPALSNMLSKSGNLAGLTDKAAARANIGAYKQVDATGIDINILTETGEYHVAGTEAHWPFQGVGGHVYVHDVANGQFVTQIAVSGAGVIAIRCSTPSGWPTQWDNIIRQTDVQSTLTDANAGKVMRVGAFGLGNVGVMPRIFDANSIQANGWYEYNRDSGDINGPETYGTVLYTGNPSNGMYYPGWHFQIFFTIHGDMYLRHSSVNTFAGMTWRRVWSELSHQISKGVFYMTAPNCPGVQLMRNNCTFVRHGDLCRFNVEYVFGVAQGDAPTGQLLVLQGLPFISQDISPAVVECRTDQLRIGKQGGIKAMIDTGKAEIYFVIEEASGETTNILTDVIKPTTYGVYQSFNITGTYKVG